ncbi:glycosyltransferase family 2 protein [Methylobrevis pamukkalensis]|uniref:Glycosyl transferase family 2 n=1 Tax=Methylobrevis pamukkalensis TaxID=1439726 RepID=A0A1E3GZH3_9HYPH|nr:glycosyltransferase family 2 protein [Methylobrevis pamukkalensis]ODN69432.1 Glycosyl transferase family 2 [Methylobrevis pamukkalensis]
MKQADGHEARQKLSCYIRTLNEERMIGRVIAAAQQAADEVLIVDSGSTDRTIEIAEAAGARVLRQPWLGNGAQKRAGEEAASHDILLDLDADEIVSPELAREIRALMASDRMAAVHDLKLVTVDPTGRAWTKSAVAFRRKLYDRRVIRMPDHKAWDQLEIPKGLTVGRLQGTLFHHSFRDLEQFAAKLNRVSTVRAREVGRSSKTSAALRVVFALPVYFLKHFLQRGLWRLGVYGVAISGLSAYGRWLRDVKVYEAMLIAERSRETR